jgi:zinc/manganese transport system permease protein
MIDTSGPEVVAAGRLLTEPFMQHALLAGTAIALAAGLVGYFLVLRAQVFTSDALGHVAYTGALGALAFGVEPRLGLLIATIATALALAGLGHRARPDDVAIGSTFAWLLGLGSFFLTLYTTSRSGQDATANVSYLFGSIFGISGGQAVTVAAVSVGAILVLAGIARPLLFVSLDEAVAAARGMPVRLLGVGFLVLVGIVCAQSVQAVGGLLLLGLVAAPAGAAHRLTSRPFLGMAISGLIGVAAMWAGLAASYLVPAVPPSFTILAAATVAYVVASIRPRRAAGSTLQAV